MSFVDEKLGIEYLVKNDIKVFEKFIDDSKTPVSRVLVDEVYRSVLDINGYLVIGEQGSESAVEYPVDIEDTVIHDNGDITFSVYDGDYIIRNFKPEDGIWASRYKIQLPVKAVEYLFGIKEEGTMSQELLAAYSKESNTGPVFGVEYINSGLGNFLRANGLWIMLSADDETFENMYATFIDPEKADDFIKAYDKGGMTVEEADTFADPNEKVK